MVEGQTPTNALEGAERASLSKSSTEHGEHFVFGCSRGEIDGGKTQRYPTLDRCAIVFTSVVGKSQWRLVPPPDVESALNFHEDFWLFPGEVSSPTPG